MKRHALIVAAMLAALVMVDVRLSADDKPATTNTTPKSSAEIVMTETPVRHLGEAWHSVAWAAHSNELWEYSALGFMNAARQDPTSTVDPYNAACAWSRQGKADEAFDWLKLANQAGWTDADHARCDEDLANIRKDPRFEAEMERWGSHELHAATHNAHKFLAEGLKAAEKRLSKGSGGDEATAAERDEKESRLRAAEKAEWQSFIDEVKPLENQLPDDGEIKFRMGYALLMVGDAEQAMAKFQAASDLGAEEQKSEYNIACCLATLGRTQEAVARLEKLFGKKGERYWNYPVSPDEMRTDYDLRAIREDEGFKALMKTLESGGGKTNPVFKKVWNNLQNVPDALATPIQES